MNERVEPRFEAILEAIVSFARHDFAARLPLDGDDELTAIAAGLNMLGEELAGEVASRRELEAALAERQAAEAGLVHAGRLAMLGQVAAGVGHEVNNPITWVSLGLEIFGRELAQLRSRASNGTLDAATLEGHISRLEKPLLDIKEGVERIRVVANDLRTFARADDAIERVSLAEVIQSSVRLSSSAISGHATIELDLQPVPDVAANRGRVSQVTTNLLVNAAQAIQGSKQQGRILVTTCEQSGGALLVVEDDGPGVPESARSRIFEPFFTTKGPSEGTGLGLALVRKIIDGYRGDIRVSTSALLGGARFEVWLPIGTVAMTADSKPEGVMTKPRRMLVIDDEPAMLRSMRALLLDQMNVEVACGGREALDRLKRDTAFDVVLCDLEMADVDGVAVLEWIESHAPVLVRRTLLCSGGVLDDRARYLVRTHGVLFIEKPITAEALESAIERMGRR